jgi:hypothetical protein
MPVDPAGKGTEKMKLPSKAFIAGTAVSVFILVFAWIAFATETKSADKTTSKDVKQETMEAVQAIKSYSIEQRDRAVKEANQVMKDLDARIDRAQADIQKKWDQMDQAAREKANDTLKALRAQRNELSEWYGGLKHSSASAWDHVKDGFAEGYESLTTAFDKAEKEFESDTAGN